MPAPGKERWREDAERFGAEAKARDIRISTIGAFYRNPLDPTQTEFARAALHRAIDVAALLGVRTVSGFPGGVIETTINPRGGQPVITPLENFIPQILAFWEPVAKYAADRDVRLAFEHCPQGVFRLPVMNYNLFGQPANWERFFNATQCENIGLEWDAGHLICQFIDPVENLRKIWRKGFSRPREGRVHQPAIARNLRPVSSGRGGTSVARLRIGELVGDHSRVDPRRLRFRPEHRRLARSGVQRSSGGCQVAARRKKTRTRRLAAGETAPAAVTASSELTEVMAT